jgi:hypothetical protein
MPNIVDRDQKIGHELHAAAVAEYADIMRLAGEILHQRLEFLDLARIAAGVKHEVAMLRLRAGPTDGTVDGNMASGDQHPRECLLVGDRQRAELNDDASALRIPRNDLGCRDHRLGRWQAGQDLLGLSQERGDMRGDDHARRRRLSPCLGGGIVADHAPAGGRQVACDGTAHDAEADDPHSTLHRVSPSGDHVHRSLASDH